MPSKSPVVTRRDTRSPFFVCQCLKLLVFWARHLYQTSREPNDVQDWTWNNIRHLSDQKTLEDNAKDGKDPPVPEMTLEQTNAAACFSQMRQYLCKLHSKMMGLPLDYVIWVALNGPFDYPDAKEPDPPPFGDPNSPYVSVDDELVMQAPILDCNCSCQDLRNPVVYLKHDSPFKRTFIANSAAVYNILHTEWGSQAGGPTVSLTRRPRMEDRPSGPYMPSSLVNHE
jgi:hypothetical protein